MQGDEGYSVPAHTPFFFSPQIMAAGSQAPAAVLHREVMDLVIHQVRVPEDMDEKLKQCSKHMNIRLEALIVFALVRFLEVQGWLFKLWR